MKYKAKIKDCHLRVRAKTTGKETVDSNALNAFAREYFRGFLKPKLLKPKVIEYSGPVGVSLSQWLKKPISGRDFLVTVEQVVLAVQKAQAGGLAINRVLFNMEHVYINEGTKELQFIYVLTVQEPESSGVMGFLNGIIARAKPADTRDAQLISRFAWFLQTSHGFSPEAVEAYINREDRTVVSYLRRQNSGSSGFMTSKRQHYYEHYDAQQSGQGVSQYAAQQSGQSPQPFSPQYVGPQGGPNVQQYPAQQGGPNVQQYAARQGGQNAQPFAHGYGAGQAANAYGGWAASGGGAAGMFSDMAEQPTGLLADEAEQATSLLADEGSEATGLLMEEEGTMLLQEAYTHHFPSLTRVLTGETISINKPVFRLGKERSYVDYFVSNNNAVSRSHADIITRGTSCFVVDLNSKNHTYINDQILPIRCEMGIADGDRLRLGNEEFVFHS